MWTPTWKYFSTQIATIIQNNSVRSRRIFGYGLKAAEVSPKSIEHCSDVWAISRSDLDSSKYAVFEGFTNQNMVKNQKLIFFLNVLILFMVYWDGPMSLVKLGWTTSSKYSFERNILTAIWSSWIYKAKLIFSPWFHLYFRPSQLHQIYRSS